MVEFGRFYFDEETSFPAVVIKDLGDSRVLVRVWTDSSDRVMAAPRSDSPGSGVFVSDT